MLVRSVLNKSFDQNKLSELSISVSVGERQRKDCDMKNRISREKTAVTRYTIRNKHFHAPFRLLLIRKWKQQLLLLHLPFHSHYSYCEVHMSVFQWKRWLVCRWKSYFPSWVMKGTACIFYFENFSTRVSVDFLWLTCVLALDFSRFFMKMCMLEKYLCLEMKMWLWKGRFEIDSLACSSIV